MAVIYSLGEISGAHINPAVTLAFTLRGGFSPARVPGYWAAQLSGASLAALVIYGIFGNVKSLGATVPHHGVGTSLVMEIILTFLLVSVIIGSATGHRLVGHNAGIAVGGTVALCGLFGDPISGASMNPARSIGPALIARDFQSLWIYLAGPVLGALVAVILAYILLGRSGRHEEKAAAGEAAAGESRLGARIPGWGFLAAMRNEIPISS